MQKLNTNKNQIFHSICLWNYNSEKPPQDNYQEDQWQIHGKTLIRQENLYTLAWEAEIGRHLFDFPFIYTDPNARYFDENHKQGPDTVSVPRSSNFHESSLGQNGKLAPLLTHLRFTLPILTRMVKVKPLRPLQT